MATPSLEHGEQEYHYGELVWAQSSVTRGRWWPGTIYDPRKCSGEIKAKERKGCYLVAFFGDNTCNWVQKSQVLPFEENLTEKAQQKVSTLFSKAVQEALDHIEDVVAAVAVATIRGTKPVLPVKGTEVGNVVAVVPALLSVDARSAFAYLLRRATGESDPATALAQCARIRGFLVGFQSTRSEEEVPLEAVLPEKLSEEGGEKRKRRLSEVDVNGGEKKVPLLTESPAARRGRKSRGGSAKKEKEERDAEAEEEEDDGGKESSRKRRGRKCQSGSAKRKKGKEDIVEEVEEEEAMEEDRELEGEKDSSSKKRGRGRPSKKKGQAVQKSKVAGGQGREKAPAADAAQAEAQIQTLANEAPIQMPVAGKVAARKGVLARMEGKQEGAGSEGEGGKGGTPLTAAAEDSPAAVSVDMGEGGKRGRGKRKAEESVGEEPVEGVRKLKRARGKEAQVDGEGEMLGNAEGEGNGGGVAGEELANSRLTRWAKALEKGGDDGVGKSPTNIFDFTETDS